LPLIPRAEVEVGFSRGAGGKPPPTDEEEARVTETHDPRQGGPQPPYPEQEQAPPGLEGEMSPKPDYGEETYRGSGRLEGRAALITGGDSGIGRAVAVAFAREGADVVISYLDEHEDARETARVVEESGRRAIALAGDVGDEAHCRALVDCAVTELGRLDVLVNNAATQMKHESLTEIPSDEIERVFRTNILAMFWLCKAAIPHLRPGSAIVNTTSIQAYEPSPELIHYATTKGAIATFTKALAKELVERGIRVNAVAPGPVWTPLIAMSFPAEEVASFGEGNPLGRPAQPVEMAPVYVFLASDESRFVVGEVIGATGGQLLPS
jgi:NAD(P)-dependent dehydrogenase (short-subunit alcohol dehydrogenase family)